MLILCNSINDHRIKGFGDSVGLMYYIAWHIRLVYTYMTLGSIITCYVKSKLWNISFFWIRAANIKKARGSYFSEEVTNKVLCSIP